MAEAAAVRRPRVSFEFFRPNRSVEEQLWEAIRKFEPLNPSFFGDLRRRAQRVIARTARWRASSSDTTLKPRRI